MAAGDGHYPRRLHSRMETLRLQPVMAVAVGGVAFVLNFAAPQHVCPYVQHNTVLVVRDPTLPVAAEKI